MFIIRILVKYTTHTHTLRIGKRKFIEICALNREWETSSSPSHNKEKKYLKNRKERYHMMEMRDKKFVINVWRGLFMMAKNDFNEAYILNK